MIEGIELPNREKSECSVKRKLINTWEHRKRTPSNMRRLKKQLKKNTSGEQGNYSKPNYIAEISLKG